MRDDGASRGYSRRRCSRVIPALDPRLSTLDQSVIPRSAEVSTGDSTRRESVWQQIVATDSTRMEHGLIWRERPQWRSAHKAFAVILRQRRSITVA